MGSCASRLCAKVRQKLTAAQRLNRFGDLATRWHLAAKSPARQKRKWYMNLFSSNVGAGGRLLLAQARKDFAIKLRVRGPCLRSDHVAIAHRRFGTVDAASALHFDAH